MIDMTILDASLEHSETDAAVAAEMLRRARNYTLAPAGPWPSAGVDPGSAAFLDLESPDAPEPTLGDLVRDLARARFGVASLKELAACHQTELEKTAEWAALQGCKTTLAETQARTEDLESRVRALAAEQYDRDGNKHPHPAITIRVNIEFEYDSRRALSYAVDKLPNCVKLDARAFEKAARAFRDAGIPLDFVAVNERPAAAIATDLAGYMDPIEDEEEMPF